MMKNHWKESANVLLLTPSTSQATDPSSHCDYQVLTIRGDPNRTLGSRSLVLPGGSLHAADFSPKWWSLFDKQGVQYSTLLSLSPEPSAPRPPIVTDNLFLEDLRRSSSDTEDDFVTTDMALRLCAIRNVFQQTGILLVELMSGAKRQLTIDVMSEWRERVCQRPDQFVDMCSRYELKPRLWSLHEWWNWLTPTSVGRSPRFDTMYYLCAVDTPAPITTPTIAADHHQHWSAPAALLANRYSTAAPDGRDGYTLSPPQIYELSRLVNFAAVKEVEEFARLRQREGSQRWLPSLAMYTDGAISTLPGDDYYPDSVDLFATKPVKSYAKSLGEIRAKSGRLNRLELRGVDCEVVVDADCPMPCGHIAPVNTGQHPPYALTIDEIMASKFQRCQRFLTVPDSHTTAANDRHQNTRTPEQTPTAPAITTASAAADTCQRLLQLIDDFTKRELKEVLMEFRWALGKNRAQMLLQVRQLIYWRNINVDRLSLVVNDIHERKVRRRSSAKRSSDNGHTYGQPKRPNAPHSEHHSAILTPTVPIIVCPPIADSFNMNLWDNSGQEVVTDCAFRRLPKYTIVKLLREPQVLTSVSDRGIRKYFTLYKHYFPDIYSNLTEILAKNRMQIQLRISRTAEQAAKDKAVSQWCRLGLNDIQFSLSSDGNEHLLPTLFEIRIVKELTDQSFVEYLTADSGHRFTADETKALIRRKFVHNSGDDGISLLDDWIQVSLMCPVSQRRLRIPCRTVKCEHIECFDGQSVFAVNEWRSEWLCPICQAPADTSHIRVDTYFKTVLAETSESVTTIRVKSDGNYVIGDRFDGQVIQLLNNDIMASSVFDDKPVGHCHRIQSSGGLSQRSERFPTVLIVIPQQPMTDTTTPPLPQTPTATITAGSAATTTTPAALWSAYQRLHQLIDDFTKCELKEVLKQFQRTEFGKNRAAVLSRVQQLIDGRDVDVDRLSLVVNDIHERKVRRPLTKKRRSSEANGHTNGQPKRPNAARSGNRLVILTPTDPIIVCPPPLLPIPNMRPNAPHSGNHSVISTPTGRITGPPPLLPIPNIFDTNLWDNSGQEVVTDCAFRRLPKYTIVKQLYEPQVLTSISDRKLLKSFTLYEDYFPDIYWNLTEILAKNQMQIQLRFSHTAEPAAKDSVPEALCIDVNHIRVYTHSAGGQVWCRPYDVSQYCRLGVNDIEFSLSSAKSEYLLPTLFEVSIVIEQTDQSFVEYLTADSGHRWTADETKALINRKFGHNSDDDGIS
ncbi:unnamed protein product, partial [Medioppia subpectinata]